MRTPTQYAVHVGGFLLGFYVSEIFEGGPCNIWFNIDISHSNTSLLGLDEDWDSKIGPQTVGGKVRRGRDATE